MKLRFYFPVFLVGLFFSLQASAQLNLQSEGSDALTLMEFEHTEYDLGTIKAGEVVKGTFKFKNIGKADLLIENVKPSCVCTTLEYPEEPLKPGQSGEIYAEIETDDKHGDQVKYFTVIYNGNPPVERVKLIFSIEE